MYIAIDFDGTIADHKFPKIGDSVPGAFEWIRKFKEADATLILWTMRSDTPKSGAALTDALAFCEENGITFDLVNENPQDWTTSNKVFADIYIDNSAFGCPLRENPRTGGRPVVDWEKIGPTVMEKLEAHQRRKERLKAMHGTFHGL